ncbi:hypothetical protein T08_6520 [Trichinella sp. T8]|nr:hypothetical protein T08_6520 [Trichinella sp. T8]
MAGRQFCQLKHNKSALIIDDNKSASCRRKALAIACKNKEAPLLDPTIKHRPTL